MPPTEETGILQKLEQVNIKRVFVHILKNNILIIYIIFPNRFCPKHQKPPQVEKAVRPDNVPYYSSIDQIHYGWIWRGFT